MNVRLLTVVIAAPPDVLRQAIRDRMMECPTGEINISKPFDGHFSCGRDRNRESRDYRLGCLAVLPVSEF
jgi:hypothetical protein